MAGASRRTSAKRGGRPTPVREWSWSLRHPMRIAIGCDDAGFPVKTPLITALESEGHVVLDLGCFSTEPVDYPDYARVVGQAVVRGFADAGVLVCGSATGASMAANKLRSIRAAFCPDVATARHSREQDNANVLCLSAGVPGSAAAEIVKAWANTTFSGVEVHARLIAKIAQLEDGMPSTEPARRATSQPDACATVGAERIVERQAPTQSRAHAERIAPAVMTAAAPATTRDETAPAPISPPAARPPRGPDPLELPLVNETLAFLESQSFLDRLWTKDVSLWRGAPAAISTSLGWLTAPAVMRTHVESLRAFADEVRRLRFSQVIVLGMGGSAACADLFGR